MEKKKVFTLPNKKVRVVPVVRKNSWLPKGHDGEFMFTGTSMRLTVPVNGQTGQLIKVLTDEEQAGLEKILAMNEGDLSIYKPTRQNFWNRFEVVIDKEGDIMDLSDPDQYIKWKVLLANKELVAPSFDARRRIPTAKFMLVDLDHEIQEAAEQADLKQSVWMEFGAIKNNQNSLKNVLKIYTNKQVPSNSKHEFLVSEVMKIVDKDPNGFIKIIQDDNFNMRCFVEDAIEVGAIVKHGRNKYIVAGEPDDVFTIKQIMEELDPNGPNAETYIKIKDQIEKGK